MTIDITKKKKNSFSKTLTRMRASSHKQFSATLRILSSLAFVSYTVSPQASVSPVSMVLISQACIADSPLTPTYSFSVSRHKAAESGSSVPHMLFFSLLTHWRVLRHAHLSQGASHRRRVGFLLPGSHFLLEETYAELQKFLVHHWSTGVDLLSRPLRPRQVVRC